LLFVALGFAIATVLWTEVETTLSFTRFDQPGWDLGNIGWCVWAVLLIYATTNGVNLTDGLDGLAAGSATLVFSCLMAIGFWAFRHPETYHVPHALDIAVAAAAMVGACAGLLWWSAAPARIFMGDTGSLAIGAGVACIVLTLNVHLLLPIVGALYVTESLSVILQVGSFRLFKRRIFRMAPIHHHFELGGWPETTVIVRFWLLSGACAALALGLFYADFIGTGGLD
jgi:phospho-N-acetylmuramoyl-pentapeptide-transferase